VQGATAVREADLTRQREVVDAFLAASRGDDFRALLALLDPGVVLRSDGAAARSDWPELVHGARDVAGVFVGRARVAKSALIDGAIGAVWAQGGKPRVVFTFGISEGNIVEIGILADAARLEGFDLAILER
jgi:RNA polymerase sigma-70 factor, ECF subfamily